jgi:Glucose-6-phosphate isomerase
LGVPVASPTAAGKDETMCDITATPEWQALLRHHAEVKQAHLRDIFADDPARGRELTVTAGDLYLDFSKHRATRETLRLLIDLAAAAALPARRDAMLRGEPINVTENRSVLHTALRMPRTASLVVDGADVVVDVHRVLDQIGRASCRERV